MERTLIIVKPDAVSRNLIGKVLSFFEENNLKIVGMRLIMISEEEAQRFYQVHKKKEFYEKLVSYISSGPSVVAVIEGDDAVVQVRAICGDTDPSEAAKGTIRSEFGINITMNSVHASDSQATAREEVSFFFPDLGW